MALYRNEQIPPYDFVSKLKKIDPNLYAVFDSLSMRWDIYFKDHQNGLHHVLRVKKEGPSGDDEGYMSLDDRTINKLLRMDLKRRNMSAKEYKTKINDADIRRNIKAEEESEKLNHEIYKDERYILGRAFDSLRGVERTI